MGGRDQRRMAGPVATATFVTFLGALLVGVVSGDFDLTPSAPSLFWLLLYGVTSQSLGYLLISISLPRLPAVIVSVILLVQPVITVGLARVLIGETPSAAQTLGVGAGHLRHRHRDGAGRADLGRPAPRPGGRPRLTVVRRG